MREVHKPASTDSRPFYSKTYVFQSARRGRRRAQGWDYVALPLFQARTWGYTGMIVRLAAGIKRPEGLKGKRIGTADYQQTAAVSFHQTVGQTPIGAPAPIG